MSGSKTVLLRAKGDSGFASYSIAQKTLAAFQTVVATESLQAENLHASNAPETQAASPQYDN